MLAGVGAVHSLYAVDRSGQAPYAQKGTGGRLKDSADNIYQQSNGQTLLNVVCSCDGCAATFHIGLRA